MSKVKTHCIGCRKSFKEVKRYTARRFYKKTEFIVHFSRCEDCNRAYNAERSRAYRRRRGKINTKKDGYYQVGGQFANGDHHIAYLNAFEQRMVKHIMQAANEIPLDHSNIFA